MEIEKIYKSGSFAIEAAHYGKVMTTGDAVEHCFFIISLKDEPVVTTQIKRLDPNIRATKGVYYVKYWSDNSIGSRIAKYADYKYAIVCDMLTFNVRVRDYKHFCIAANYIPELAWLKRNTSIGEHVFGLAKLHQGMLIPFCMNMDEYVKMIKAKAFKMGLCCEDGNGLKGVNSFKPLCTFKYAKDGKDLFYEKDIEIITPGKKLMQEELQKSEVM